jgi:hypothetical protein
MEMEEVDHYFQFSAEYGRCSPEEYFIQANGIAAFDGLNLFS